MISSIIYTFVNYAWSIINYMEPDPSNYHSCKGYNWLLYKFWYWRM